MIKEALAALGDSARELFRNWRSLLLLAAVYALLLASLYLFFATGVANAWQLVLTAATAGAAPLLFLLFLGSAANAALRSASAAWVARRAPRDLPKVLLLALPVVALAALFVYLLGKLPGWLPRIEEAPPHLVGGVVESRPSPLYWQDALTSTLWLTLLGFALPLLAAHLWLAAARHGLGATLKKLHRVAAHAFAGRSVLVYALGLFVFGLTPYFVIYTRTSVSNGWAEIILFGLRLGLAFALTLAGWVITLGGLARVTPPLTEAPAPSEPAAQPPAPSPAERSAVEPQLQA
jgi:hypothetical protein